MAGVQMLFPIEPDEFWQKMKVLIEEILERKINNKSDPLASSKLIQKSLFKMEEVCELFRVTKPTIYEWVKKGKLKSLKIQSRRYFQVEDLVQLISDAPR